MYQDNETGQTALHWAALRNRPEVVQAILKHPNTDKEMINMKDHLGFTAFHAAAWKN